MESLDDDIHDNSIVDSLDYCDDDDVDVDDDDYDNRADVDSEDSEEYGDYEVSEDVIKSDQNYTILKEDHIQQLQQLAITEICNVLPVSRGSACLLLGHYNWAVSKVTDDWVSDEDRVRKTVGLLEQPIIHYQDSDKELMCMICFENYRHCEMHAASCGHRFCGTCWQGYITTSITDGPGCLMLRCPEPKCTAAVDQDMVNTLVSDDDKDRYARYLVKSYVDTRKNAKWCPAPGCDCGVEFEHGGGNYDVCCTCSNSFCWNCKVEAHGPVDCKTVAKWLLKNSAEAGNTLWIICNSKPCPSCQRPIEKNHGCMHMTCTPPCNHHFCWVCLGPWTGHGDFYSCNKFSSPADVDAQRGDTDKKLIRKYAHYVERWQANEGSEKMAAADFRRMHSKNMQKLSNIHCATETELKFVTEAWLTIINCRHILKWTYAYGFYLPDNENEKKQFFEDIQGESEEALDRLHRNAEKDIKWYLSSECQSEHFSDFRAKLSDLTISTQNYFENLLLALENGLSDVSCCTKNSSNGSRQRKAKHPVASRRSWLCECGKYNRRSATLCWSCDKVRS